MKKFYLLTVLSLFTACFVLSQSLFATGAIQKKQLIKYEGSSTIGKFISDAAKVYTAASFEKNIDTESLGGYQCALKGSCDVGGVADSVVAENKIQRFLIGKDAIAVIVNKRNPVNNLSKQQLKDIFTGKVNNWSQLGGEDAPIKVFTVQDSSATRHVFRKQILGTEEYHGTEVVAPDRKIISKVTHAWGGIGQISFAFLNKKTRIKTLDIGQQKGHVHNPNYPITRPLYLLTHGKPSDKVQKFIDWSRSDEGQKVVKKRFVGYK
ncbi:MAG: phosphate ABC transporter substrate-binding protein [gamma proteobacterium symbiont of Taylorina sp.]|nr:phosphate ABC transporter substrate-binding protein [gamma proteobacterium symbiont of Taylorina sp.]